MSQQKVIRRLTVLREDADKEPLPQRKFFHIGVPEVMEEVGECIPMIAWVDDNLSRFVVADGPSSTWGRASPPPNVFSLPNHAVKAEDGIFLITGPGADSSTPNPNGKNSIHFIHLGASHKLWDRGLVKIYVYRLEGVQFKALLEKKR
jgi:hypothetical protein